MRSSTSRTTSRPPTASVKCRSRSCLRKHSPTSIPAATASPTGCAGSRPMNSAGYWWVLAIQDWVQRRTRFVSGSSNATTSAVDTVIEQAGVCRDFAHLMIALCRAVNIPARFVTGIDYASDPVFGPPDFHAYVEAFLGGRWYLFDTTGMVLPTGLIRLGTGRDAADVSFATIFGTVKSWSP